MITTSIALVPEYGGLDLRELLRVSAAIQKQIVRDVAPIWGVTATVDPFERLEDVPLGYWPVILTLRDLAGQDGAHLDDGGAPYALVEAQAQWSLAASHECIELLVDPSGNRTVAGRSPRDEERVEFLVEPCDPCQCAPSAYTVNDVVVSDFVTPEYFGPVGATGGRYSFSGRITRPRDLLAGGCLTWVNPVSGVWWQREMDANNRTSDQELATVDARTRGQRSLREVVNSVTRHHHRIAKSATAQAVQEVQRLSALGRRASSSRGRELRSHVQSLAAPPLPRAAAAMRVAPPLEDEIRSGIAKITERQDLPDRDRVLDTLKRALDQCKRADALAQSSAVAGSEEYDLSLVRSAIRSPLIAPTRALLTGRDIVGFSQYESLDVRWLATVYNHLFRSVVPFPVAPAASVIHALQPVCSIALAGDWGTGDASSRSIAAAMADQRPTYTIHLGDVYYSGTEEEETEHLLRLWPRGTVASFTLNSNHEMYSGGHGYFGVALASEVFETQGPYSYFALVNDDWAILGLDSAHAATEFYQRGALNDPQISWLKQLEASGTFARPGGARKKVLVLTHHQGLGVDGKKLDPLWTQVTTALRVAPDYWYWGHDHGVVVFKPVAADGGSVQGRLVGHGGVPYAPDPLIDAMVWTEAELAGDAAIPKRALNGFAVLHIEGGALVEEMWDERGQRRWRSV
jgi:hypothetical protein